MPSSRVIAIPPRNSSVVAALRDLGLRKAGTPPLLMASTPVSAAQPDENARAMRKANAIAVRSECSAVSSNAADSACRSSPPSTKMRIRPPQRSMTSTPNMKAYVGMANAVPASRKPRRFTAVRRAMAVTANSTLCCATNGTAEPMFAAADEIDTATVST